MEIENVHENYNRSQEGGTGILAFDAISGWVSESGTDITGLVRGWCIKLKGNNGHTCRIVCT